MGMRGPSASCLTQGRSWDPHPGSFFIRETGGRTLEITPRQGQHYASTRFEEQRQLHLPQKHKATVPESSLRLEMNALEERADHAKACDLYKKPLSWLGTIRPSSANDAFDKNIWATFVSMTLGLVVPSLSSIPSHHNNPLAKCGCKKHCMDFHGDHTSTCTAHSGAAKAHDWMVGVLGPSHGRTHGPHAERRNGKRRPTARRR
jgi:hypothetical protein